MIEKLIDDYLLAEQVKKADRIRSGLWSPSSFGRCFRNQFWNRKNEPQTNPPDLRALKIFKVGNLFHDFIQGMLPNCQHEVIVKYDDIFGYADIVTEDTVIDIKSQHSKGFWYMEQKDYDINKEKETNILQVCTYAWILKKPKASLFLVSKDDLCVKEYGFNVENWIPKIEEELKTLRGYWDKNELPEAKPRAFGGKEGRYCSFCDKCLSMGFDCIKNKPKEEQNGNT